MESTADLPPPSTLLSMPRELLLKILQSCTTVSDLFHFCSTCHLLHAVYKTYQTPTLSAVCESQLGPLDLAVSMIRRRLGSKDDTTTPMTNSEMQELICCDREITQEFAKAYVERRLPSEEKLSNAQMRRLRSGLYRKSIFTDRFQKIHLFPDVKRDFGIPDEDEDEFFDKESRPPGTGEPPPYARWLMALSADELFELEDIRLLISEIMRSLYPRGYRSTEQTWINRLPYSILQSSLNTMDPMVIGYLLQDPSDTQLKDDELNPLTEENQSFLDEAIWCALRLKGRGVGAGRGYVALGDTGGNGDDELEDFEPEDEVVMLEEALLGMPMGDAYEALMGFLAGASGVGAPTGGGLDDLEF